MGRSPHFRGWSTSEGWVPLEKSEAIVLRVYPWSESSCVTTLFTRDFGKVAGLAKGARRRKSPFEAALDLLSICRVVFISKSADALDVMTEAKLIRRFRVTGRDLLPLYCGYYIAELLDRMTDKGDRQPETYDLAVESLVALQDAANEPRAIVLRFELGLLRLAGNLPSWQQCAQCGSAVDSGGSNQHEHGGVKGDGSVVFGAVAGGVLCPTCQTGGRVLVRVPIEVTRYLESFSKPQWREIPINEFMPRHRPAIRGLMARYWTVLLDRKLQLHSYLQELGR